MVWIWAGMFIATLVGEIMTVELLSIWFSLGSLVAFILALCGVSTTIQIIVFLAVSSILLICLRSIFMRMLKNTKEKTNLDSIIGTTYTLQKEISKFGSGEIKVNGVIWRVISESGEEIPAGETVQIVEIQGNKFVVKKEIKDE